MLNAFIKRIFDMVFSFLGLICLSPVLAVCGLLILCEDGKPVFFRQVRVGRNHREFKIWKFRTMYKDAGAKGMQITVSQDPRITCTGKYLRRYKLDELPQLINVLLGEMSFVGPRPEVPAYVEYYNETQRGIFNFRPGITDPASLYFIDEQSLLAGGDPHQIYVNEILPKKLSISMDYQRRQNVFKDLVIILKTLGIGR